MIGRSCREYVDLTGRKRGVGFNRQSRPTKACARNMPPVVSTESSLNPARPARLPVTWSCVGLATVCLFLANAWRTEADADLWGHLRFGLETLSTHKLPETDPYSYTAVGAAWTNHEWLSELMFAACYRAGGTCGLILLRGGLLALTFGAIGIIVVRRHLSPTATLALALFGITFLPEFYRIRPQMFTYTAFAWLIVACDGYRAGSRWILAGLPILFGLWCNFHAGFVAGLGILGIYWCSSIWDAVRELRADSSESSHSPADGTRSAPATLSGAEWQFLGLVLAACVAATLCNPYGIEYWRYVLAAITMPRPAISEWGPVWSHHPLVWACYLAAVLVPIACWLGSTRRAAVAETAAFVLVAYLAARHARHIPFAMILGAAVFSRRWTEACERWGAVKNASRTGTGTHVLREFGSPENLAVPGRFVLALLVLAAILGSTTKLSREVAAAQTEGILTVPSGLYPVAAVAFLEDHQLAGNLYCGFSWGEYCLWHLSPHCPVFCDGRYETVYPAEISALALSPLSTQAERCAIVEHYPTEIVLVPADAPFAGWLAERHDFAEIYRDELARIFLKRSEKFADTLQTFSGPSRATGAAAPQVPFPG